MNDSKEFDYVQHEKSERLLGVEEMAQRSDLSVSTIRREVRRGRLPRVKKYIRRVLVSESTYQRWMKE